MSKLAADGERDARIRLRLRASGWMAHAGGALLTSGCIWAFGVAGALIAAGIVLLGWSMMLGHEARFLSMGAPLDTPGG